MLTKNKGLLFFLAVIFLISVFLRFYKLGQVPNGLSPDEADIGYNTYSVIKTGADVYGKKYPLFFQSLDDYKPGLPYYLSIPAINLFGLNEFSIRALPAFLGSLIPILVFYLAILLYPKNKKYAYFAGVLTALAPWSIQESRAMIVYSDFTFLYLLFLIFFLLGLKKNGKYLILSALFLSLTLYTYYAAVIYIVPTLAIMVFLYRFEIFKNIKYLTVFLLTLCILSLPAVNHYLSPVAKTRLNAISVFSADVTLPTSITEIKYDQKHGVPLATLTHNRRFVFGTALLENYFRYFDLDYLFVNSSGVRYFYVNYVGLFYLVELPFVLYGLYLLIKKRSITDKLLLGLLLIAPFPAMITLGTGFVHRALLLLPVIQIISAVGAVSLLYTIDRSKKMLTGVVLVIYVGFALFFLHQYFIHSPQEFSSEDDNGSWFSTVKDAISYVDSVKGRYTQVVFTSSKAKLVPGIYFLFYNKIDPTIIQAKSAEWKIDPPSYRQIYNKIGNFSFRPINWTEDQKLKNTLFVGYPGEFTKNAKVINKTYLPNGQEHFYIVQTQ